MSFDNTKYWFKQIQNAKQIPVIFVGNKYDLKEEAAGYQDTVEFMQRTCSEWNIQGF